MTDKNPFWETWSVLESYGVDLSEEKYLISGRNCSSCPILLIAGTQSARIFDLMQGLDMESPVFEYFIHNIPIQCGYGTVFHIQVEEQDGGKHHFSTMEDVYQYFAERQDSIKNCYITVPAPILQKVEMRFLEIGEGTEKRIAELASDCTGFLLVLPCAAGAPGDDMQRLCRWIREIRGLPERTGIILNHTETGQSNTMLPLFLNEWLGVKAPYWKCCYSKSPFPQTVLGYAVKLAAGETEEADDKMLQQCLKHISEKIEKQKAAFKQKEEENLQHADWLAEMEKSFRANVENAGAVLHFSLTSSQEKELRQDIEGMMEFLYHLIPDMIQEVVEQRDTEAKNDLKNLVGDYVEMLFNHYITALAEHICQEEWLPQVKQAFQKAVDDFYILIKTDPIISERSEMEQAAYLKSLSINLGDYINSWALGLGTVTATVISIAVRRILQYALGDLGVILSSLGFVRDLTKKAGRMVAYAVDEMTPPKKYGEKMAQMLQKNILSMSSTIFDILKFSMLPAVNEYSLQQYQGMVDNVCETLQKREKVYRKEVDVLQRKAEELEHQYQKLLTEERAG